MLCGDIRVILQCVSHPPHVLVDVQVLTGRHFGPAASSNDLILVIHCWLIPGHLSCVAHLPDMHDVNISLDMQQHQCLLVRK